jgi:hypothetical protein
MPFIKILFIFYYYKVYYNLYFILLKFLNFTNNLKFNLIILIKKLF